MFDLAKNILIILAIFFVIFTIFFAPAYLAGKQACQNDAENFNLEWRYQTLSCQVKTQEYGWLNLYTYIDLKGREAIQHEQQ